MESPSANNEGLTEMEWLEREQEKEMIELAMERSLNELNNSQPTNTMQSSSSSFQAQSAMHNSMPAIHHGYSNHSHNSHNSYSSYPEGGERRDIPNRGDNYRHHHHQDYRQQTHPHHRPHDRVVDYSRRQHSFPGLYDGPTVGAEGPLGHSIRGSMTNAPAPMMHRGRPYMDYNRSGSFRGMGVNESAMENPHHTFDRLGGPSTPMYHDRRAPNGPLHHHFDYRTAPPEGPPYDRIGAPYGRRNAPQYHHHHEGGERSRSPPRPVNRRPDMMTPRSQARDAVLRTARRHLSVEEAYLVEEALNLATNPPRGRSRNERHGTSQYPVASETQHSGGSSSNRSHRSNRSRDRDNDMTEEERRQLEEALQASKMDGDPTAPPSRGHRQPSLTAQETMQLLARASAYEHLSQEELDVIEQALHNNDEYDLRNRHPQGNDEYDPRNRRPQENDEYDPRNQHPREPYHRPQIQQPPPPPPPPNSRPGPPPPQPSPREFYNGPPPPVPHDSNAPRGFRRMPATNTNATPRRSQSGDSLAIAKEEIQRAVAENRLSRKEYTELMMALESNGSINQDGIDGNDDTNPPREDDHPNRDHVGTHSRLLQRDYGRNFLEADVPPPMPYPPHTGRHQPLRRSASFDSISNRHSQHGPHPVTERARDALGLETGSNHESHFGSHHESRYERMPGLSSENPHVSQHSAPEVDDHDPSGRERDEKLRENYVDEVDETPRQEREYNEQQTEEMQPPGIGAQVGLGAVEEQDEPENLSPIDPRGELNGDERTSKDDKDELQLSKENSDDKEVPTAKSERENDVPSDAASADTDEKPGLSNSLGSGSNRSRTRRLSHSQHSRHGRRSKPQQLSDALAALPYARGGASAQTAPGSASVDMEYSLSQFGDSVGTFGSDVHGQNKGEGSIGSFVSSDTENSRQRQSQSALTPSSYTSEKVQGVDLLPPPPEGFTDEAEENAEDLLDNIVGPASCPPVSSDAHQGLPTTNNLDDPIEERSMVESKESEGESNAELSDASKETETAETSNKILEPRSPKENLAAVVVGSGHPLEPGESRPDHHDTPVAAPLTDAYSGQSSRGRHLPVAVKIEDALAENVHRNHIPEPIQVIGEKVDSFSFDSNLHSGGEEADSNSYSEGERVDRIRSQEEGVHTEGRRRVGREHGSEFTGFQMHQREEEQGYREPQTSRAGFGQDPDHRGQHRYRWERPQHGQERQGETRFFDAQRRLDEKLRQQLPRRRGEFGQNRGEDYYHRHQRAHSEERHVGEFQGEPEPFQMQKRLEEQLRQPSRGNHLEKIDDIPKQVKVDRFSPREGFVRQNSVSSLGESTQYSLYSAQHTPLRNEDYDRAMYDHTNWRQSRPMPLPPSMRESSGHHTESNPSNSEHTNKTARLRHTVTPRSHGYPSNSDFDRDVSPQRNLDQEPAPVSENDRFEEDLKRALQESIQMQRNSLGHREEEYEQEIPEDVDEPRLTQEQMEHINRALSGADQFENDAPQPSSFRRIQVDQYANPDEEAESLRDNPGNTRFATQSHACNHEAAQANPDDSIGFDSQDLALERALREAKDEEERQSILLARQLQEEEERRASGTIREPSNSQVSPMASSARAESSRDLQVHRDLERPTIINERERSASSQRRRPSQVGAVHSSSPERVRHPLEDSYSSTPQERPSRVGAVHSSSPERVRHPLEDSYSSLPQRPRQIGAVHSTSPGRRRHPLEESYPSQRSDRFRQPFGESFNWGESNRSNRLMTEESYDSARGNIGQDHTRRSLEGSSSSQITPDGNVDGSLRDASAAAPGGGGFGSRRDLSAISLPSQRKIKELPGSTSPPSPRQLVIEKKSKVLGSVARLGKKGVSSLMQTMKRSSARTFGSSQNVTSGVASENNSTAISYDDLDAGIRGQMDRAVAKGVINQLVSLVKDGKEATIYYAEKGPEGGPLDVAVKVYKRARSRSTDQGDLSQFQNISSAEHLEMWTIKEYRNLKRAKRAFVPAPAALLSKGNTLFMEFMGTNGRPAPQLGELDLRRGHKRWKTLYKQIVEALRRLYVGALLVHGNLNEWNVLVVPKHFIDQTLRSDNKEYDADQAVLIDFGQTVDSKHPDAMDLLRSDLQSIRQFFVKQGIRTPSVDDTLQFVTSGGASSTEFNKMDESAKSPS